MKRAIALAGTRFRRKPRSTDAVAPAIDSPAAVDLAPLPEAVENHDSIHHSRPDRA